MRILVTLFAVVLFAGVAQAQEIIVTTDKKQYTQGEAVTIILKNRLRESIFSHIASATPGVCIKYAERKTGSGGWQRLFTRCEYPNCIEDVDAPSEVKPGEFREYGWNPLIYVNGTQKRVKAEPGAYRLAVSYQLRSGSASETCEWKTVNSNEFTIK